MSILLNIVVLLIILSITIFIHELGHLLAAKKIGCLVKEFSIGFGPKIFCKKRGDTNYCIRLIPLGGFVDILGDDEDGLKAVNDPRSLRNKPISHRMFVMLAGVTMNYLLAVALFYILLISNGFSYVLSSQTVSYQPEFGVVSNEKIVDYKGIYYDKVVDGSPAKEARIPSQGYIKEINHTTLTYSSEIRTIASAMKEKQVLLTICKKANYKECKDYKVTVGSDGKIGIYLQPNFIRRVTFKSITDKVFSGFEYSVNWISFMKFNLKQLFTQAKIKGDYKIVGKSVGGPVALYSVVNSVNEVSTSWKERAIFYISLTADISMTLFLMNIIPIPALDGGRVLLLAFEAILKDRFNRKVEAFLISSSFILLLILMAGITLKDILAL